MSALSLLYLLLQDLGREAGGKHLAPQQLGQALAVVQALADVVGASGGGATAGRRTVESSGKQQEALLVPDDQGVLRPAAELAFDDAPWLDAPTAGALWLLRIGGEMEQHTCLLLFGHGLAVRLQAAG